MVEALHCDYHRKHQKNDDARRPFENAWTQWLHKCRDRITMSNSAHAYLVESIPKGLEDLRGTPGVAYTEDVLVQLTSKAKSSIDLTAMYWALLANPSSDDEKGFTPEELDAMGAGAGRVLYEALRAATQRGVRIRILQSPA